MSKSEEANGAAMVPMRLARIVRREGAEQHHIYLMEREGERFFPIVIGSNEAGEIHRVVTRQGTERPLTHQLSFEALHAVGARIDHVDIVDLQKNTFFAQLVLADAEGGLHTVDARPSDAIALALREECPVRVSEVVLQAARSDQATDALPPLEEPESEDPKPEEPEE